MVSKNVLSRTAQKTAIFVSSDILNLSVYLGGLSAPETKDIY